MFKHSVLGGRLSNDGLKRHRRQARDYRHQFLRHAPCLGEIRDDGSREMGQRRDSFHNVTIARSRPKPLHFCAELRYLKKMIMGAVLVGSPVPTGLKH